MAMNRFKSEWKNELDQLTLTKSKKEQIINRIQLHNHHEKMQISWKYPFVLTTFIALMFTFVLINVSSDNTSYKTASGEQFESFSMPNIEILLWGLGFFILVSISIILTSTTVIQTARWNEVYFVQWFKKMVGTKSKWIVLHSCISFIFLLLTLFLVGNELLLVLKTGIIIFLLVTNCFIYLWSIRKYRRSCCPHCQHPFTRKELMKLTWSNYKLQCFNCGEKIYLSAKSSKAFSWVVIVPFLTHFPLFFLGFPYAVISFSFLVTVTFYSLYITNYTTIYSKEDEPLW